MAGVLFHYLCTWLCPPLGTPVLWGRAHPNIWDASRIFLDSGGCSSLVTWDAHGVRDCRALQKASPKAAAFYTFGRGVILHFAAPLLLQIALGSVDLDAVGGGFAAANRIEIYRSKSNL